jgi:hypothetical protein
MADRVREDRKPASADNPLLALQEKVSDQIVANLDAFREMTEAASERMFLSIYGSPLLQAAVGIDPANTEPLRKAAKSPLHRELQQKRIDEMKSRIATGGLRECLVRGLLYVGMARGGADERGLAAIRRLRSVQDNRPRPTLAEFKALVREQYYMLLIDQDATLAAIPELLPADTDMRRKAFAALHQVLSAVGETTGEAASRLQHVASLFGVEAGPTLETESNSAAESSTIARAS